MHEIKCIIFDLDHCLFDPDSYSTFGDERHILPLTSEKILVTKGFPDQQWDKIAKAGIAHLFSEIQINAVEPDGSQVEHKEDIFRALMCARQLAPRQIMVVGDNPLTELGAGKRLGMVTVQTLRPTVQKWPDADYHITSLAELADILRAISAYSRRRGCAPL